MVLDASLTLTRFLVDESSADARAFFEACRSGGIELLTTAHWQLECWNGLLMAHRRRRITKADLAAALRELRDLPIIRLPDQAPVEQVLRLAEAHALTVYDAAYLALALRERAQLATIDARLAAAAKKEGVLWKPARRAR